MSRVSPCVVGVAAALLAAASAAAQPAPPPEDETSPLLLQLIRAHLAEVEGLGTADGVQVQETRFFRGTVRVRGTVASAEQRDAVRREITALRPRLEMSADVRITEIDVSGLQVAPGTKPPTTGGDSQQPGPITSIPEAFDFPGPWPGPWGPLPPGSTVVSITVWWPPFPPPSFHSGGRRHSRRRHQPPPPPPPPPPFFFFP
jgi:hypothetical protein